MPEAELPAPPRLEGASEAARLRAVLDAAGYDEPGCRAVLSAGGAVPTTRGLDRRALVERTAGGTPIETLMRLFVLGVTVARRDAAAALQSPDLEDWRRCGLVEPADLVEEAGEGGVHARVMLGFHRGLRIAADLPRAAGMAPHRDSVLPVAISSTLLSHLTLRNDVARTLDLCSGGGVQALSAAAHSGTVVGVERNPRALAFARFNALLNGVDNVEWRQGDLFVPVDGERFDLVVANPPFAISPHDRLGYADSDMPGDTMSRAVVRGAVEHLVPGGVAHVVCTWAVGRGESPAEHLAAWIDGLGCDLWVVQHSLLDPHAAATRWLGLTADSDAAAAGAEHDAWVAHYRSLGIDRIGLGVVTARRRDGGGAPLRRFDGRGGRPRRPCGDELRRGLALWDWLEAHRADGALTETRLRLSPAATLHVAYRPSPEGWLPGDGVVRLPGELCTEVAVDHDTALLLEHFDGRRPLAAVLAAAGAGEAALPAVRSLVECGVLLPDAVEW